MAFTRSFDRAYGRFARVYDLAVRTLPVWRTWLTAALDHVEGPRVLEVSFGTGWLLSRIAPDHDAHGVELNERMIAVTRGALHRAGTDARLARASVESLPYRRGTFDTVVNTMAFTGYPDAGRAMAELARVLRPDGRLVMIDVNFPADGNRRGTALVRAWQRAGDLVRDLAPHFAATGFEVTDEEIGGWGSVHRYLARRRADASP